MTKSEYADYNKTFHKNKKKLLSKGGKIRIRYIDIGVVYSDDMKKALFTTRIYLFDIHLEDLENGIAPESPGIFGSQTIEHKTPGVIIDDSGKIDQRNLDCETERGLH